MDSSIVTEQELAQDRVAAQQLAIAEKEVRAEANRLEALASDLEERVLYLKDSAEEMPRATLIEEIDRTLEKLDEIHDQQYEMVAAALHHRHTAAEVRAWCENAQAMGADHPSFRGRVLVALMHIRRVPNAVFRERFIELEAQEQLHKESLGSRSEETWASGRHAGDRTYVKRSIQQEVLDAMGWDEGMLKRSLGMRTRPGQAGQKIVTLFLDYEVASRLAPTLGLKPYEAGI